MDRVCPLLFFGTLGKIEEWLTDLEVAKDLSISEEQYNFIKASLYNAYFEVAMQGNLDILNFDDEITEYLEIDDTDTPEERNSKKLNNTFLSYKDFLNTLNHILYERRSSTVSKSLPILPTATCILAGLSAQVPVMVDIGSIPEENEPDNKTIKLTEFWYD